MRSLAALLGLQGCLSYPDDQAAYTLTEIRELFRPIAWTWYGRYYRHPLWECLRNGTLSLRGLAAWLVHNYHISRSAGMSDARCAVRSSRIDLRAVFSRNALDEYSHCEDYFFVRASTLGISDADMKQYVHLAPSLAFDQQMLRMADDDWLGHVLVSLFQESTSRFADQARAFYRQVEANYNLPGLFRPWERHLELDLRCNHAGRLDDLLSSDLLCERAALVRSLRNAWFTFEHLYDALDSILRIGASGALPALRLPIRDGLLDPAEPFTLQAAPGVRSAVGLTGRTALSLHEELTAAGAVSSKPVKWQALETDSVFLSNDLARTLFIAMGHSAEHDQVLLFGRLAEAALRSGCNPDLAGATQPASAAAMALANLFRELGPLPDELAFALWHASACWGTGSLIGKRGMGLLSDFLRCRHLSPVSLDRLATLTLQLNEVVVRWGEQSLSTVEPDFFRD